MTPDLFNPVPPKMTMTAVFSGPDDCYRDELRRIWDESKPLLVVCMLNPSTASHLVNDPTVLALIHFAKAWGYGGLLIVNLYNWRSPSPAEMKRQPQRLGATNHGAQCDALAYAIDHDSRVLVAWGNDGDFEGEATRFADFATSLAIELICLGKTASGAPKHPMARGHHRIQRDQQPIVWRRAA